MYDRLQTYLRKTARPVTVRDVAGALGVDERSATYVLMEATKTGRIRKATGGRFEEGASPWRAELRRQHAELLEFVRICEVDWRLDNGP